MINIVDNTFILKGSTNTGIYVYDNKAIIIDPGLAGLRVKKIINTMKDKDIEIKYILNTHEHNDHYGGCYDLKQEFRDIKILSSYESKTYIQNPELFNKYIVGGKSNIFIDNKNKRMFKGNIDIDDILNDGKYNIDNNEFEIFDLPGHTMGSKGILTPNKVLFVGDALIGKDLLAKHDFLFTYDVKAQLETYNRLLNIDFEYMILSHGKEVYNKEQSIEIIDINKKSTNKYIVMTRELLRNPSTIETLLKKIINLNNLRVNYKEYHYLKSSLISIISYLSDEGYVEYILKEGELLYYTKLD